MTTKSKLIDVASMALLPLRLKKEGITAYQCPEEDNYDFVVSIKQRFIRIELKAINGDSKYLDAERVSKRQLMTADFVIIYLLDNERNRFFTIPIKRVPREGYIRFSKRKDRTIKGKWMKYEGFDALKKDIGLFGRI